MNEDSLKFLDLDYINTASSQKFRQLITRHWTVFKLPTIAVVISPLLMRKAGHYNLNFPPLWNTFVYKIYLMFMMNTWILTIPTKILIFPKFCFYLDQKMMIIVMPIFQVRRICLLWKSAFKIFASWFGLRSTPLWTDRQHVIIFLTR